MATIQKTGSLIIQLEQYKEPPKLVTKVSKIKGKDRLFKTSVIHPNDKRELYSEEFKAKSHDEMEGFKEAMVYAATLLKKPELKNVETFFEETLHIPQWKKGSMALNTEEEMMAQEMEAEAQEEEKKTAKKALKANKTPKKATTEVPKVKAKAPKKAKKEVVKAPKKTKASKVSKKAKKAVKSIKKNKK